MTHGQLHRAATKAADPQDCLLDAPPLSVITVDGEQDVAGKDAGSLGRGVRQWTHNHDEVVLARDSRADALKGTGEVVAGDGVGLWVDVDRVWVAKRLE